VSRLAAKRHYAIPSSDSRPQIHGRNWPMIRAMTIRRTLLLVGLALVAGGLLLGFLPRSVSGVSCGSPFIASKAPFVADLSDALFGRDRDIAGRCADARSAGQVPAILLLVVGGVLSLGTLYVEASAAEKAERHRKGAESGT
jgi:hypothetical protein